MHFSVIGKHRDFLRKHHWIECEEVIPKNRLAMLQDGIDDVLKERVGSLSGVSAEQMFHAGRDLWRESATLKKIILQKEIAEIASELIEHKPLRFGYDQLLPSISHPSVPDAYHTFLSSTLTLQEMSAIQGVICGAMICLKEPYTDERNSRVLEVNFPLNAGNITFFLPDVPIHFDDLKKQTGAMYLMLVYTKSNAVYLKQERDPHLHEFKRLGYNFGDRLTDKLNPLVYQ